MANVEHGIVDEVRWNDERPVSPTRSAIESIATRYAGILVVDVDQELVIATRIVHHANDDEVRIGNDARDIEFRIAPLVCNARIFDECAIGEIESLSVFPNIARIANAEFIFLFRRFIGDIEFAHEQPFDIVDAEDLGHFGRPDFDKIPRRRNGILRGQRLDLALEIDAFVVAQQSRQVGV